MSAQLEIKESSPELESLFFVRALIPEVVRLIPRHLVQNVKGRSFTVDEFLKHMENSIECESNFLFLLIDDQRKVQGYLWAEWLDLGNSLFINTFSIDKAYWHNAEALTLAMDFVSKLVSDLNCKRVMWITTNPRFFEKHGFKRSRNVLMEYNE